MAKRGVSNIVITVLIILISLALIGILWVFFSPFLFQLDETTNVADCYTAQFTLASCEYSALFTDNAAGRAYKPIVIKVDRKQGPGNITGFALQAKEGNRIYTIRENTSLGEFNTITKSFLFPLSSSGDFTPSSIELYPLVGDKRKLCKNPSASTQSCVCHQVTDRPNVGADINCDGAVNGFDTEAYTDNLFLPYQNQSVSCQPNAASLCPNDDWSNICPDIDGDGVVRYFDVAEVEAWVGGGTAGCQG